VWWTDRRDGVSQTDVDTIAIGRVRREVLREGRSGPTRLESSLEFRGGEGVFRGGKVQGGGRL